MLSYYLRLFFQSSVLRSRMYFSSTPCVLHVSPICVEGWLQILDFIYISLMFLRQDLRTGSSVPCTMTSGYTDVLFLPSYNEQDSLLRVGEYTHTPAVCSRLLIVRVNSICPQLRPLLSSEHNTKGISSFI